MTIIVELDDGARHQAALVRRAGGGTVIIDGKPYQAALRRAADGAWELQLGERRHPVHIAQRGEKAFVHACGRAWTVLLHDPVRDAGDRAHQGEHCVAPMPGTVVELKVTAGDTVSAGQTLLVMESMKMQITLQAECDGTVAELCCAPGQSVERDALLVRLTPKEA